MSTCFIERIALVTDFGMGPYIGQMQINLASLLPDKPVIDLVHDLPAFRPDLAAYLLPALLRDLPPATLYLCIVDPGVGSLRDVLLVEADGHWLIGPDNGLLALVARNAPHRLVQRVDWRPHRMSDSFQGRDLFVPLAARVLQGQDIGAVPFSPDRLVGADWPDQQANIIYRDHYGNLMTALRAGDLPRRTCIVANGCRLGYARTFCEMPPGIGFWYENAFGLVELAVNQGRANKVLRMAVGDPVELIADNAASAPG